MKKILHIAANTAQELLHTAVKLVSKLASLSLKTVKSGLVCAGKVLKKPVDKPQSVLSPVFKLVMIASAALAALSCLGWLLTRKKAA